MLSLKLAMVAILYTASVWDSLFSGTYTFVGVPLLTLLCMESNSVG